MADLARTWSPIGCLFNFLSCLFVAIPDHEKKPRLRSQPQAGHCVTRTSEVGLIFHWKS